MSEYFSGNCHHHFFHQAIKRCNPCCDGPTGGQNVRRDDREFGFSHCCPCFCCCCPPFPSCHLPLIVTAVDALTSLPLSGAVLALTKALPGAPAIIETTTFNGTAIFHVAADTQYTLVTQSSPVGYQENSTVYEITVDAECNIFIDGILTNNLIIPYMLLGPDAFGFVASKVNSSTLAPLADAVFLLSAGGSVIQVAFSDFLGQLAFSNLAPGFYQLVEIIAPAGYQLNPTIYSVSVSSDGIVLIDGDPATGFILPNVPNEA